MEDTTVPADVVINTTNTITATITTTAATTTTTSATNISDIAHEKTLASLAARKRKSSNKFAVKKKKKKTNQHVLNRLSFGDEIGDSVFGAVSPVPADSLIAVSSLSGATAARFKQEKSLRRREKKWNSKSNVVTGMDLLPTVQPSSFEATSTTLPKCLLCLERAQIAVSQTIGRRNYMEDRHTVITDFTQPAHLKDNMGPIALPAPSCYFVAVYDGHGGASVAECAKAQVHLDLQKQTNLWRAMESRRRLSVDAPLFGDPSPKLKSCFDVISKAITASFLQTDTKCIEAAMSARENAGSTAAFLILEGGGARRTPSYYAHVAHAGDSRIVLCRNKQAVELTRDHKPNRPDEHKRVTDAGGSIIFSGCWRVDCPGSSVRLAVSRSFGDVSLKMPTRAVIAVPEVSSIPITPADDFIILASDGLWDVMNNADAVAKVLSCCAKALSMPFQSANKNLSKYCADELIVSAMEAGADDNITVVVVLLYWRKPMH